MVFGPSSTSSRLNLLIADGAWQADSFSRLLPPLLGPLGVRCLSACSAAEVDRVARVERVHIAVVDLSLPQGTRPASASPEPAGGRVIKLLRRLEQPPAMVIVRPRCPSPRLERRGLVDALEWGAFAVIDRPAPVESLLSVLHAVVARRFGDRWPEPIVPESRMDSAPAQASTRPHA